MLFSIGQKMDLKIIKKNKKKKKKKQKRERKREFLR
jgi:hypothetical protein